MQFIKIQSQKDAQYFKAFQGLSLSQTHCDALLANGKNCKIEVMGCRPKKDITQKKLAGHGKHIVYFPGANTYYQACFRDITTAAKETGATIHAFNFPGIGSSSGKVSELNDVVNAGIAVVNQLIRDGVHPDDIILQGDCYGAGIALEVSREFQKQSQINIRTIMKNGFKSFKSVIIDQINKSLWAPDVLRKLIKNLLVYTGWHMTPGKHYGHSDPYHCYLQTEQDHTLQLSKLSLKMKKYKTEASTGITTSKKRPAKIDNCPEEYKKDRNALDKISTIKVREDAIPRLKKKFGTNSKGEVNAHFADLCELEMQNGGSVYENFINRYITASDQYITNGHRQTVNLSSLPHPLKEAHVEKISHDEAEAFEELIRHLDINHQNDSNDVIKMQSLIRQC